MNYGYQDIQRVMKEASVSFEQADKALKRARGNINEAVIMVLRKRKGQDGVFERALDAFARLFRYRLLIEKDGRKYLDIALWIMGLIVIMLEYTLRYDNTSLFIYGATIMLILFSGSRVLLEPKSSREDEPELVNMEPMQEDDVLQNYPDDEVAEEDGFSSVEV